MQKDKLEGKSKEAMGTVKEKTGEWTGDQDMEAEGTAQKMEGKTQGFVGDVKDKAGDMADKAKDAFKKN